MEDIEKWRKAGQIAAQALEYGKGLLKKENVMLDVCDLVDKKIIELGARPAWPTQVGLNHVAAHFTPDPDDRTIFDDAIVCLDVGVHVDGCIGDNAVSVDLSGKYLDLIKASREACEKAVEFVQIGVEIGEIGKLIQEIIESYGFSPIKNLSGHGISPYVIHDKPTIPNFNTNDSTTLKKGQIIAIEPFATTGAGMIKEAGTANLFSLVQRKPVRSPFAREILGFIEEEYETLPFTTRWISKKFGMGKTKLALRELSRLEILREYPPLVEKADGIVTVHEKTLLIDDKIEVLTKS